jgi:hypothetical protein
MLGLGDTSVTVLSAAIRGIGPDLVTVDIPAHRARRPAPPNLAGCGRPGEVLAKGRIIEGLDGVARLHALIGKHAADSDEVVVGAETDRGLLVEALVVPAIGCTPSILLQRAAFAIAT